MRDNDVEYWKNLAISRRMRIEALEKDNENLRALAAWLKNKAYRTLFAHQESRCDNVGDYTRLFVRRPRMRKLIQFLMRL